METAKRFSDCGCFINKNIQNGNSVGFESSDSSQVWFQQNGIGGAVICIRTNIFKYFLFSFIDILQMKLMSRSIIF